MNIKKNVIPLFRSFVIAVGLYFLILAGITILRPLYLGFLNQNINLKLVATGERNTKALASNVRINHITVNGKDYNLSKCNLKGKTNGWQYDSANDFIYIYNTDSPCELTVQFDNVHSLSVGAVKEVGSGIIEIYINDELWKKVDLYQNTDWEQEDLFYETSILVFPERCFLLQFGIFSILFLFCTDRTFRNNYKNNEDDYLITVAITGLLSIIVIFIVCFIQYDDIQIMMQAIKLQSHSFFKATVCIFLTMLLVECIFDRLWIGFSMVSMISVLGCITSKVKLLNRDVPLLPWDFNMVNEAASVVSNYEISISVVDIISIILIVALTVLLIVIRKTDKGGFFVRVRSSIILILILALFIETSFIHYDIEANNTDYRIYQVNEYYQQRGFISAFLEYCVYLDPSEQPDNYSEETMVQIQNEIQKIIPEQGGKKPNVIVVMSESFWDIERADTLRFDEEVLPNFKSLQDECRYGELFTHVISGGTVVSEFEFLTGFSGEFFPQDYMVYGNFLNQGFSSAVSVLEAQGYHTTAIHPYVASNYNRQNAYQNFGFDECFFDKDFEAKPSIRNYISDADMYDKVINQYEKNNTLDSPQFIFSVTMQNHGGYWAETIYEEGLVGYQTDTYGEVAQQSINDYVAGLHESDRALGELINYFRNVDDDVIVVYFGDHVSDAGPKDDRLLEQISWANNEMTYDYETHKVPFIIWSNFDDQSENLGLMEVGELMPSVFQIYNIKTNPFWNYLQSVRDVYSASNSEMIVAEPDDYTELENMTDEQKRIYDTYHLLQYDYIWGNRYAEELWTMNLSMKK